MPSRRHSRISPVVGAELAAVGAQPGQILREAARERLAREEAPPAQDGMLAAQREDPAREGEQRLARGVGLPVHPGERAVVAVGVVVAELRAAQLVAVREHRDALREGERREQIALHARAQRQHRRVVARALDARVRAPVGVRAVAILLAVGFVVLALVAHEIAQREAVVAGDEVHARVRACGGRRRPRCPRAVTPACRCGRRPRARSGARNRGYLPFHSAQPSGKPPSR